MEPLALAMQMEEDGEKFYRELAKKTANIGFGEIFTQLAADEAKHYQIFQDIRRQQGEFIETTVLKDAGNIFKRMIAEGALDHLDDSEVNLYQEAMGLEEKSRKFYLERAAETTEPDQSEMFRKIAREEEKHFFLLHNIYELVLRPLTWVENGEFVHLEDY